MSISDKEHATVDRASISALVRDSLHDVLALTGRDDLPLSEDTRLIGREAVLDSLGLVNLIVDVEQRMEEAYGLPLVLADERAMSYRHSPFRSVGSLVDYVLGLAEQCDDDNHRA